MSGHKNKYIIEPAPEPSIPITNSDKEFPVRRVFCVGKNYDDHVKEMGSNPANSSPVFFMKPADAVTVATKEAGCEIPYPAMTKNLHHEIELVVALAKGGENISKENAHSVVFGYGVGVDLTRRDLQAKAKENGGPWDVAKGFDYSAPVSGLIPSDGDIPEARIWLTVNGKIVQDDDIKNMIWGVDAVIATLSSYYKLKSGDLIFMGTPAGVGPLKVGDLVRGGVDGVGELSFKMV